MEAPAAPPIVLQRAERVATVWLQRPGQRNALSRAMFATLPALLAGVRAAEVDLVILRGAAGHFSAGADLHDVLAATDSELAAGAYADLIGQAVAAVADCAVPTLAVLEGHGIGAGLSLALMADLRLVTYEARLRLPYLHLGVVPDLLTLTRLGRLVGPGRARSLLLSGRVISGAEAAQIGLADEVVDAAALAPALATTIAAVRRASPFAVARTKQLLARLERGESPPTTRDMADSMAHGEVASRVAGRLAGHRGGPA